MNLFQLIVTQPLYNLIIGLYDLSPIADLGIAIIATTLIVKGILSLLTVRSMKAQKALRDLQPKIAEIRDKYKDDKEKQAKELMAVYRENNVNPFASCLPLLIQLPIFLALFQMLRNGFDVVNADMLYSFVSAPETINQTLFGLIDLRTVSIPLAIITAGLQYVQMKQTITKQPPKSVANKPGAIDESMASAMNNTMLYFLPAFTLIIGTTSLPGGVTLYWLVTTLVTIVIHSLFIERNVFAREKSTAIKKTQE